MPEKFKVVVTQKLSAAAMEKLQAHCEVKLWEETEPIPRETLADWLKDAEGLISAMSLKVDEDLLAFAPKLKVISQPTVGYDNVDVDACSRRGIPFGNTPGVVVEATADLAYGLLLSAARRIHEGWDLVRNGKWVKQTDIPFGTDLFGKTLGIVGMGQIGASFAKRAHASGMKIIYHNRSRRKDDALLQTDYVSFGELLERADCIVVLVPFSPESRRMFGREQFARMKPTVLFINAARGGIVDTEALYDALAEKRIAYAALDVTDPEPLHGGHPLLSLSNVLITPHVGTATYETRSKMAETAVENLLAGLMGRPLPHCVNEAVNSR